MDLKDRADTEEGLAALDSDQSSLWVDYYCDATAKPFSLLLFP